MKGTLNYQFKYIKSIRMFFFFLGGGGEIVHMNLGIC